MLDVRRMQILRAVVTSGSVTAAAAHLGYTPSAISQQVGVLEREAGIVLLERTGRGVRPTAAGRLLTGHAAVISRNLAEAETALADLRDGHTGRLAIRYFTAVGPVLVAPALTRLRREHPGVRVDLRLLDPEDPFREVEKGEADLALVAVPGGPAPPGVRLVHLLDDAYQAVLPSGHPLARQRVIELADLADEAGEVEELSELLDEGCMRAGLLLTRRAVADGDLRALQRISDAGYDEAGNELERLLATPADGHRD